MPLGRTDVLVAPSDEPDRELSHGHGPKGARFDGGFKSLHVFSPKKQFDGFLGTSKWHNWGAIWSYRRLDRWGQCNFSSSIGRVPWALVSKGCPKHIFPFFCFEQFF